MGEAGPLLGGDDPVRRPIGELGSACGGHFAWRRADHAPLGNARTRRDHR